MPFKSIKLFLFLVLLFGVSAFVLSVFHKGVIQSFEVRQFVDRTQWEWVFGFILFASSVFLIALQTLFCPSLKRKLLFFFHLCVAFVLILLLFFGFVVKTEYVLLYPQSYVEVDEKVVALEDFSFDLKKRNLKCRVFIQDKNGKTEGTVSFNSPLISSKGFLWIQGFFSQNGVPVFKFEYVEFSVVPFLIFIFSVAFLVLLPFVLLFA